MKAERTMCGISGRDKFERDEERMTGQRGKGERLTGHFPRAINEMNAQVEMSTHNRKKILVIQFLVYPLDVQCVSVRVSLVASTHSMATKIMPTEKMSEKINYSRIQKNWKLKKM